MKHNKYVSNKNVIFTFLIVILFCGTIFYPVSGTQLPDTSRQHDLPTKTIIYVDDDNTEGPWDGTLEHPFPTIIAGINEANAGDTVFVFNGTYMEKAILIDKTINLIGEDRNTTSVLKIFDPDFFIKIVADYVTVSGLSFDVVGEIAVLTKIFIDTSSHCMIMNNSFSDHGLIRSLSDFRIIDSQDITISNNIIGESKFFIVSGTQGIYLSHSQNIRICNNTFVKYHYGIDGIQVTNSIIADNQFYTICGIKLNSSSGNTISRNSIDCGVNNYGLFLLESSDNTIVCNSFMSNKMRSKKASFVDCTNTWDGNYWGRARIFPKIIFGKRTINALTVPAFQIDWHPATTY